MSGVSAKKSGFFVLFKGITGGRVEGALEGEVLLIHKGIELGYTC